MTAETEYFALLWDGDDISAPRTILRRRRPEHGGTAEEILRADGTWQSTGVLALVSLNMYEHDVRPISTDTALAFAGRVRRRAGRKGSA